MKYVLACFFFFLFSPLYPLFNPKAPRPARILLPPKHAAVTAPQTLIADHVLTTNHSTTTATSSCLASYLTGASSSSSIIPTIQIALALSNLSSSSSFFANATSTPWSFVSALSNTNIITLLLLPLVIREIPTFMTTTLDPLLDYVLDPWSWSYFPVWCAEVWRLVREEREARWVVAGAVGSVERVWRERGVVEEVTLRVETKL